MSRGQLCAKGWNAGVALHHPDRLTTALVRRGSQLVPAPLELRGDEVRPLGDWHQQRRPLRARLSRAVGRGRPGDRVRRFWTHKFGAELTAEMGRAGCVGCGRCDVTCPGSIGAHRVLTQLGSVP